MSAPDLSPQKQKPAGCSALASTSRPKPMAAAKPIEHEGRRLEAWLSADVHAHLLASVQGYERPLSAHRKDNMALAGRYQAQRAKFRGKANMYRRRAETIEAVLKWAGARRPPP